MWKYSKCAEEKGKKTSATARNNKIDDHKWLHSKLPNEKHKSFALQKPKKWTRRTHSVALIKSNASSDVDGGEWKGNQYENNAKLVWLICHQH